MLILVGATCFSALLYITHATPKRDRILIPEGYSGTLAVTFSVHGAPPLPMEDGFRVIKFNKDGEVKTSSPGMPGKLKDEYYFYSGSSRRLLESNEMGGGFTEASSGKPEEYTFKFTVNSKRAVSKSKE